MAMQANPDLTEQFLELIRRAATAMPDDVVQALTRARDAEEEGSAAQGVFATILRNIEMAREGSTPVCQDTGMPIFYVKMPVGYSMSGFRSQIEEALREATRRSYLRPNAVDPISGKNSGDNTGVKFPSVYFEDWDRPEIRVELLLKGGGSENVGAQYKLPDKSLNAGRNLDGVRKAVLHAVNQAQGLGCAPGILGVVVGGDRGTAFAMSKRVLLRKLDDVNPDPALAELEARILEEANSLGIGPMGFGGKTTLLGVKVAALHRLPACYFVTVSYMCWACRRAAFTWKDGEVTHE
jgi:fumarate hydratase class I